ncbi:MAG: DUF2585 family protein [Acidobacteriota bacterium]|nr:DUF2585 family protein [Acidobacteriota bacterium]
MRKILSRKNWAWIAIAVTVLVLFAVLHTQKRLWFCECGQIFLWVSDAWSSNTSQHLLDPYSFTHVLHGFLFCWLITLIFPHWRREWQLWLAIAIESGWEIIENSSFIIERYRETTAALGYYGDTIINSFGDVLSCGVGFAIARSLGFVRSLFFFLVIETILIFWIRDSLLLNILMLIYPLDTIKQWQAGGV